MKASRRRSGGIEGLVFAYAFLTALWLLLRALFFDQFWPLAIVNTGAEYLFWPLPPLLLLSLLLPRGRALAGLLVPALVFVGLYGDLFWPAPLLSLRGRPLMVMSFNVLHQNHDYDAIASAIRWASPDTVGLQELTPDHAAALGSSYPYHTLAPAEAVSGVGLLSRFPIQSAASFPLPPSDLSLHAVVSVGGKPLHVFVVHLMPNNFFDHPLDQLPSLAVDRYAWREAQVARLREELARLAEPALVICDCNMTDTSQAYAGLDKVLDDSFREVGWGLGHTLQPEGIPIALQRID